MAATSITATTPQAKATLRYLHVSPSKVREVLGLIRGLDVDRARDVLRFCDRAVARDVLKILNSAVANAESNIGVPGDELQVCVAYADEGPTLKRWRPRARGRATKIRKRSSHVTIVVVRLSDQKLEQKHRRESAAGGAGGRAGARRRRTAGGAAPEGIAPEVASEALEVTETEVLDDVATEPEAPIATDEAAEETEAPIAADAPEAPIADEVADESNDKDQE